MEKDLPGAEIVRLSAKWDARELIGAKMPRNGANRIRN